MAIKRLYSLRMPGELLEALQALKVRDGISESEAIRRAVEAFLKERKIRISPAKGGGTTPRRK